MKRLLLSLTIISFISSFECLAAESVATHTETKISNEKTAVVEVETVVIKSPIVSKHVKHGQLFRTVYDAEHFLYPVKIMSIDGWLVTESVASTKTTNDTKVVLELLLAPGEHNLIVIPDFDDIDPQKVFMAQAWQEKHISFKLLNNQQIAVSARLLDTEKSDWSPELYRVEIPLDLKN